ncbi:hypothetical protein ISF_07395 [Cordyceps fumosorosea ARSEF 2679]|uniref:Phosphoglycerate mutase family protein n=1 Tax=Cordyceps fumosorosea (strain ARSEF 2679) TaxID=1081104 RepID=A0A167PP72_CORFA|nr:hypothetical protein ISF_07395 [Cordyceps fumosorosea ARSEF 2679]OAA56879.1 hypothetical protein ISF_07395 [Cordyceps fumosorosea ARSEF 2679]
MKVSTLIGAALVAGAAAEPHIYLIRHAEKNRDGTISAQGKKREQCLIDVFGRDSKFNIQKIIVQNPYAGDNLSQRPYNTTLPLAKSLGLTIEHQCDYDETDCAAKEARAYDGPGNILIAWEHVKLRKVSEALGADAPKYPDSRYDLIYDQPYPYDEVTTYSEACPVDKRPALIPNSLWSNVPFVAVCVAVFLIWGGLNAGEQLIALCLQDVRGDSAAHVVAVLPPRSLRRACSSTCLLASAFRTCALPCPCRLACAASDVASLLPAVPCRVAGPGYWRAVCPVVALNPLGADLIYTMAILFTTGCVPGPGHRP